MIQKYQELTGTDKNSKLEIDTGDSDIVTLSIRWMTDAPEVVDLLPEDVEKVCQQLGAWLGERSL